MSHQPVTQPANRSLRMHKHSHTAGIEYESSEGVPWPLSSILMSSSPEGALRMLFHAYVGMLSFVHACVGIFHTFERLAGSSPR